MAVQATQVEPLSRWPEGHPQWATVVLPVMPLVVRPPPQAVQLVAREFPERQVFAGQAAALPEL